MTEANRGKSRSNIWWWLILLLFLGALIAWFVLRSGGNDEIVEGDIAETEIAGELDSIDEPAEMYEETGPMAGADMDTEMVSIGDATLATILANPSAYVGMDGFDAEGLDVPEVPTDRGFWVESDGARMFALIIDNPQEVPKDINPGQTLNISGAMVRDATTIADDLPGDDLDQDTMNILDDQDVYLLVPEENIEIL